jgi:hypothetical protein
MAMRTLMMIAFIGLLLLDLWSGMAWGHAFPDHAEPRVGATVNSSPNLVRIWFDSAIEPVFSTIRVENESGQQVDNRDTQVDNSNPNLIEVSLPQLPPGAYRVVWSVVARDGHRTEGDYTFTIK